MGDNELPRDVEEDRDCIWGEVTLREISLTLFLIAGGPLLLIAAISQYSPLDPRTFTVWWVGTLLLIPLTYLVTRRRAFPSGMPLHLKIAAAAGWALCLSCLLTGAIMFLNGYGTRVESRKVQCVGKRVTRQRDERRRTWYLEVKAWPPNDRIAEVSAPRMVWDRAQAGDSVQLNVGRGRLGIEWLKAVSLSSKTTGLESRTDHASREAPPTPRSRAPSPVAGDQPAPRTVDLPLPSNTACSVGQSRAA